MYSSSRAIPDLVSVNASSFPTPKVGLHPAACLADDGPTPHELPQEVQLSKQGQEKTTA